MLRSSFAHITGLSGEAELKLWASGILDWKDARNIGRGLFSDRKISKIQSDIVISEQALADGDLGFFSNKLPKKESVRLYPHIAGSVAYIDIETTGLDRIAAISTIALYDGIEIYVYVDGINMDAFPVQAERYGFVVTYNGARFDLPFLAQRFGRLPAWQHIDLCSVLHAWGYYGGLKHAEQAFGISRYNGMCADGLEAVRLWDLYRTTGNRFYLERLIEYNAQDVLSLELLLVELYNRSMAGHPMHRKLPRPKQSDWKIDASAVIFDN